MMKKILNFINKKRKNPKRGVIIYIIKIKTNFSIIIIFGAERGERKEVNNKIK